MQIFWPENSYTLSAQALDDKRLNKQIVELGQILSTAIWIEDCNIAETLYAKGEIYLPAYENHPVVKDCKHYYYKAVAYQAYLCMEYTCRYRKQHSLHVTNVFYQKLYSLFIHHSERPFQNYTTNHKHIKDVNEAYRQCLIAKWKSDKNPPKWTRRNIPIWAK